MHAVIMAGGRGSRFWPRSRKKRSKQTLNIVGRNTMIQDTIHRLRPLIHPNDIRIVTNALLETEIRDQLPEIPESNMLIEPAARSTAPCVGLAAVYIRGVDPDAVMAVFPADHLIRNVPVFHDTLRFAEKLAKEQNLLVTFGIPAEKPETGFGYVESGAEIGKANGLTAQSVARFVEKPDMETAKTFVSNPQFHINSGMFVWRVETIMEEFKKHLPEMHAGLEEIAAAIGTPLELKAVGEIFPRLQSISIDHGIMEKTTRAAVIPADLGWNDLGSWSSLYDLWPKDEDGNTAVGRHISIDTNNCLVYSPHKFVAVVGVRDLVIVETDDALLVCHRDEAQKVSRIVDILRERKLEEYL